ncbi:MAG: ABC-2 type transport system permease protein [Planctomycetota bacterium]|jgi:ABC-2 type transport system permease protein
MIARFFRLELRAIRGDGRVVALVAIALATLVVSVWIGVDNQRTTEQGRADAVEVAREQWDSIENLSAHAVAHYGSFVYKPNGALAMLDSGVMPFTGKVLRVEAHAQNPPAHSDASSWSSLVRLGAFDAGIILAQIIPLLLAFTAFSSVARDREAGLLRMLIAQGVSMRTVLWGKVLAYWSLAVLFLATLVSAQVLFDLMSGGTYSGDSLARLMMFSGSHAVHLLIVVLSSVWISARIPDARSALAVLTIAWLGATVLMPRITAQLGSQLFPLNSQIQFEDGMKEDRAQGLDGHDPADERRNELLDQILAEHGVEEVSDLPVNVGGLLMQADEDYGNLVWDEHYGDRHETVRNQIGVVQTASFLNPFLAIRGLSMAFAGTDQFHDAQFQRQAEDYRRELVLALNDLDAQAGSRDEDGRWNREEVDYSAIADFRFQPQTASFALSHRWPELLSLLLWLVLSVALLTFGANRIPIVGTGR